jgi:hypothetical protein
MVCNRQACGAGLLSGPALAGSVAFQNLKNGAMVGSTLHLDFEVTGMDVRPAKDGILEGMHHLPRAAPAEL